MAWFFYVHKLLYFAFMKGAIPFICRNADDVMRITSACRQTGTTDKKINSNT
jgi:hypothetical protein